MKVEGEPGNREPSLQKDQDPAAERGPAESAVQPGEVDQTGEQQRVDPFASPFFSGGVWYVFLRPGQPTSAVPLLPGRRNIIYAPPDETEPENKASADSLNTTPASPTDNTETSRE